MGHHLTVENVHRRARRPAGDGPRRRPSGTNVTSGAATILPPRVRHHPHGLPAYGPTRGRPTRPHRRESHPGNHGARRRRTVGIPTRQPLLRPVQKSFRRVAQRHAASLTDPRIREISPLAQRAHHLADVTTRARGCRVRSARSRARGTRTPVQTNIVGCETCASRRLAHAKPTFCAAKAQDR